VVATRLGAFADRVEEGVNGWLVEPSAGSLLARVRQLHDDRQQIAGAIRRLAEVRPHTASTMAAAYAVLVDGTDPGIPLSRYALPRRSHRNPYLPGAGGGETGALYVNRQYPYGRVFAEFLDYSARKMEQTPRVPGPLRRALGRLLRRLAGGSKRS
jgi:hypothetical protein